MSAARLPRLAALALAFVAAPVLSADDCADVNPAAIQWLDKMSRSSDQVSYQGVVTLQRDNEDMQVVQVSHTVDGEAISDRMTQLTGQGAEVTRKHNPLDAVHPGQKLLRLEGDKCGIAVNYKLTVTEGDRVAGRKSVRIAVAPRDMYRYGHIMELDRETGLLLKSATIGHGNTVLEKFQFASLTIEESVAIDAVAAAAMPAATAARTVPEPTAIADSHGWKVGWLPAGFTSTDLAGSPRGRKTFTDGLTVFSVFIEELDREIRPGEGVVRKGSSTSYTRGVKISGQPVLLTVIGEVPVNTARMVADSVAWER
ncbi:hypothetical protein BST95_09710 [Halioglobus japonicus]|uniref:Negative regulator for alginate biosynthesis n=1 Tax=Halioglobus japonicus TaxID=930805 RepID=A0AAP8MEQ5_9GAMM|nr:MucB/RseB C-terminal domain-containing protein [Halioglobus japonicus]AQA18469.1 hypothetical protein BST95_09710 [Halioglobus japonicus]PLW86485.1 negative regulator for alginate biosynthesis [Halioglobus japonicus]GHD12578.1 sigma factor AlgU regulatory protein MucB [Halioglobus japonicus]